MTDDTRSKYDPLLVGQDDETARQISRQVRSGVDLPPSTFRKFLPELSGRCLNLARHNMPQIEANSTVPDLVEKGEDERERVEAILRAGGSRTSHYTVMQHFLASLVKRGVRFTDRAVPVRDLSPTQADVDPNKVYGMADTFLRGDLRKDRILVSRDGYILDGHHRWAALALVNPARMQSVREIGMDIKDLLDESLKFPGVFKEGVSKKAARPEVELKKLLAAWSGAIVSALGPGAKADAPDIEWNRRGDGAGSGWFEVNDPRLPRHTSMSVTVQAHGDGTATLNMNLTLPYEWLKSTSEKIRGPGEFEVELEGDVAYLHLDADKHARALMDVLRPVIALEEQNKLAAARFNRVLPSLLGAVRAVLIRSGVPDTVRISAVPLFGNGDAVQTDQGTPFLSLQLFIYGVLSKKDKDKGFENRLLRRSEMARIHEAVSEVFDGFDEDGVRVALSTKAPTPTSDDAYSNSFYLYLKDGPVPSVRLARENHPPEKEDHAVKNDPLRAATIRLAHENPELRPHLLPLLAKTAAEVKPELVPDLGYLFFVMNGIATQEDTKKSNAEIRRRAPVSQYRLDHYFRIIDEIKKPFAARIKATENVPADKKDVEKLIASVKEKFDATQTPGSTMVKMLEKFLATGKRPSYAQVK